jgi:hypothetical protein
MDSGCLTLLSGPEYRFLEMAAVHRGINIADPIRRIIDRFRESKGDRPA